MFGKTVWCGRVVWERVELNFGFRGALERVRGKRMFLFDCEVLFSNVWGFGVVSLKVENKETNPFNQCLSAVV